MIRVLHSELQKTIGGIETFLMELSDNIDTKEYHFDFLMRGHNATIENKLLSKGFNIYFLPENRFEYIGFVKKILKENKYDYVHIHKNSAIDLTLPLLAKNKSKIVIHSHNTKPSHSTALKQLIHKFNRPLLNRIADEKVACSELAAKWMFGTTENVKIIYNGINISNYLFDEGTSKKIREKYNINDKTVLCNVGKFRRQKNHKFILKLMQSLPDNFVIFLVGTGPLINEIKELTKEYNLENRIIFTGELSNVSEILMASDVFIMPSLWEGLPIAAIEAQASGLQVLLADNITKMCNVTGEVHYIPLQLEKWKDKIIKTNINGAAKRKQLNAAMKNGKFDSKIAAKNVIEIYKK